MTEKSYHFYNTPWLAVLRAGATLIIAGVFVLLVWIFAPKQLVPGLVKGCWLWLAIFSGYWADRFLFPYGRPHIYADSECWQLFAACMLRRSVIIAACAIAVSLGA